MDSLDQKQAMTAMFLFLEQYWRQTNSDDVAGLLGSLSIQEDGMPADQAMWSEWQECCEQAAAKGKPSRP